MQMKAFPTVLAAGALAVGVAACGSSKAAGVVPAPQGGATAATNLSTTPTTSSSTSTSTTAAATTPKSGPLSKQPAVSIPKGPAPKTLVKKDLITGTGKTAQSGDQVVVNYVGKLYSNGKTFDSSWSRHQTFGPFQLGQGAVIKGWDEGVVGMKVGGRRELIIPPSLAYGKAGQSGIPANSTLVFVVDLLSVSK